MAEEADRQLRGDINESQTIVASLSEKFLDEKLAPLLFNSMISRFLVVVCYIALIVLSVHGVD